MSSACPNVCKRCTRIIVGTPHYTAGDMYCTECTSPGIMAPKPREHTYWHGSRCTCSWGADHGNGTGGAPDFADAEGPLALTEVIRIAEDLITWAKASDTAAGAVIDAHARLARVKARLANR